MIDVLFLLLPGSLILDWAGPAEALRIANVLMREQGGAVHAAFLRATAGIGHFCRRAPGRARGAAGIACAARQLGGAGGAGR